MYRVLIVDDDQELALVIQDKLKDLGESMTASAGYEAINILKTQTFNLVISDYNMKDGDGASLAHYCVNHGIPVIVVSSFPENHIKPYLPENVEFVNKFNAIRGKSLEELVRQKLSKKTA
ncbi:MAG TPA: response regulator [Oligoflexus sp.]|uniref:response regulator n=1 Tax=Oligoflexus sp. TaxID=1971216 RepID=UPI002D322AF3|nr:response regulator [Oligoflexus sp.]HYX36687.1 response regulator [Oligoflexus sp.]